MNFTELLKNKADVREQLKNKYNLPKRSKILIGVHFSNSKITKKILDGLAILPANFIIFGESWENTNAKNIAFEEEYNTIDMTWIDAILWSCDDVKIETIMETGTVPLVNENSYLGKILVEFHPGRAEWNAYLYDKESYWSAYYALIRYLENHKFPYDNRNLVKNVVWV